MKKITPSNPITFFSSPLMIEEKACIGMLDTLNERAALIAHAAPPQPRSAGPSVGGIAIIPIYDVLSYRTDTFMSFLFGSSSYDEIAGQFRAALNDPAVKTIILDVNSPGGEVAGLFDLADEIYNARGQKQIIAIANEFAYSAAYALASSADKVYLPRTGGMGSIGVLTVHIDRSGADAKEGLVYTMIYAGDKKVATSGHAPLSDEAKASVQADIDAQYAIFVDLVARNRGLKPSEVRAQQAGLYRGKGAVEYGLADGILSWGQLMKKLNSKMTKGGTGMKAAMEAIRAIFTERAELKEPEVMASLGYVPKLPEGSVVLDQAGVDALKVDAHKAGKDESVAHIAALSDMCSLAGKPEMLSGLIKSGISIEEAKKAILDEKAKTPAPVISTVGATTTGAVNPLLEDAKARAGVK